MDMPKGPVVKARLCKFAQAAWRIDIVAFHTAQTGVHETDLHSTFDFVPVFANQAIRRLGFAARPAVNDNR
eukprot:gene65157-89140_t